MALQEDAPAAYEILPGLFVGGLRSLGKARSFGITHILSIVNFEVNASELSDCQTLRLPLRDDEGANLLEHLPAAITFLEGAFRPMQHTDKTLMAIPEIDGTNAPSTSGRALIHCQAGSSRSCAVAAAYIMRTCSLGADEALQLVRKKCPLSAPNEGFVSQLQMFGDMRCSLNAEHPVYRTFFLQQVARKYQEDGYVDPDSFTQLPADKQELDRVGTHRCRSCRRILVTANSVVPADAQLGQKVFRDYRTVKGHRSMVDDGGEGGALFVHPMAWMASSVVGHVQGKLYCPGCGTRLGSFNWAGITNTTGAWITPAFQLHTAKLDLVEVGKAGVASRVHMPLFGPSKAATPSASLPLPPPPPPLAPLVPAASPPAPTPLQEQVAAANVGDASIASTPAATDALPLAREPPATAEAVRAERDAIAALEAGAAVQSQQGHSGQPKALAAPWFTHLIFDCDGVMVDSEQASCESLRQSILKVTGFDIPHQFPEDYHPVFGMDVRNCVKYYKGRFNMVDWHDVEAIASQVQEVKEGIYLDLTSKGIAAFGSVRELIAQAVRLGIVVGVASSGAPAKIRHNLTSAGLIDLISPQLIVSASEVAAGKPSPDVYIEALRRSWCSDPARALVIEDAVNGLHAARGAGAFAVGISNSLPREVLAPFADMVIEHLSEIDLQALRPAVAEEAASAAAAQ